MGFFIVCKSIPGHHIATNYCTWCHDTTAAMPCARSETCSSFWCLFGRICVEVVFIDYQTCYNHIVWYAGSFRRNTMLMPVLEYPGSTINRRGSLCVRRCPLVFQLWLYYTSWTISLTYWIPLYSIVSYGYYEHFEVRTPSKGKCILPESKYVLLCQLQMNYLFLLVLCSQNRTTTVQYIIYDNPFTWNKTLKVNSVANTVELYSTHTYMYIYITEYSLDKLFNQMIILQRLVVMIAPLEFCAYGATRIETCPKSFSGWHQYTVKPLIWIGNKTFIRRCSKYILILDINTWLQWIGQRQRQDETRNI